MISLREIRQNIREARVEARERREFEKWLRVKRAQAIVEARERLHQEWQSR